MEKQMEEKQDPPPSLPASKPQDRRVPATFELPEGFANASTEEAVKRAQSGDLDALNLLFERYHQLMVEVARRKLGPRLRLKEDPVDLAQTTFREATRDFQKYQYRGEGSLLKWLSQILQNKIRDKAEFYSAGKRDTAKETALNAPAKPGSEVRHARTPGNRPVGHGQGPTRGELRPPAQRSLES